MSVCVCVCLVPLTSVSLNESTLGGELGDLVPLYISKHIALADFARAAGSLFDMRGAPQLPPVRAYGRTDTDTQTHTDIEIHRHTDT